MSNRQLFNVLWKFYLTFTGSMQLFTKYTFLLIKKKKSQPTIQDTEQVKSLQTVERSNMHNEGCM
jgi:hypothetical protein